MEWLLELGYIGLFIGSLLAATVIPFSSDFLLIGMLAAGGDVVLSVVFASLGNWAGGMISYYLGHFGRWEWIEKWFKVKHETLEKHKTKIDRWGSWLAFWSWLPFVGDIFALALGFYRVPVVPVAGYMLLGKTIRFVGWAIIFLWLKPLFS